MYREPAPRPKRRLPLLDRFTKRTPCKAPWSDMTATRGCRPEVIARIVRHSFGRFLRVCYENAFRSHPALEGRITIHFEIARDGSVWRAKDQGSEIPDPELVACVVRSAESLSFPSPEGDDERVTLPLDFSPPE